MITDLNVVLVAALRAHLTVGSPLEFFEVMRANEVQAQFVSPFIPARRQVPVALVCDESDDEQVGEEANNLFLKFVARYQLGYDDFPPDVRVWDHQVRKPKDDRGSYLPLEWNDEPKLKLIH